MQILHAPWLIGFKLYKFLNSRILMLFVPVRLLVNQDENFSKLVGNWFNTIFNVPFAKNFFLSKHFLKHLLHCIYHNVTLSYEQISSETILPWNQVWKTINSSKAVTQTNLFNLTIKTFKCPPILITFIYFFFWKKNNELLLFVPFSQ